MKGILVLIGYILVALLVWIAQYIYAIKKYKKENEETYYGEHPLLFDEWDDFCINSIFISALWIIIWIPYLFYKGLCAIKRYIDEKFGVN